MLHKKITVRIYWVSFIVLSLTWVLGLLQADEDALSIPWILTVGAIFFACYFLIPLMRSSSVASMIAWSIMALLAIVGLWPSYDGEVNLYYLLMASILAAHASLHLPSIHACIVGVMLTIGALAPAMTGYPSYPLIFIIMYTVILALAIILFRRIWMITEATEARNEALLDEYRKLKRRVATSEELARQEERAQVGRDIHDSVGHKLTALLMQLEIFRMQASGENETHLRKLKELAQESLQETRNAVKELKSYELGGLPAIIRLIRQLEAENIIKVHFTIKYGAMSATLTGEQSITVYRAVQEAITNVMKHSSSREAEIMFEAPGGRLFRFEILSRSNNNGFQEGFGLRSMRERIEQCNGRLDIISNQHHFIVSGSLPLHGNS